MDETHELRMFNNNITRQTFVKLIFPLKISAISDSLKDAEITLGRPIDILDPLQILSAGYLAYADVPCDQVKRDYELA